MTDRACKVDADLLRLWRVLLPGTPVPTCGAPKVSGDAPRANRAGSTGSTPVASKPSIVERDVTVGDATAPGAVRSRR